MTAPVYTRHSEGSNTDVTEWVRELEAERDLLRDLIAGQVRFRGPYESCTHPECTGKHLNGCWGLLPWDEEGWLVPDPCAWCKYTHEHHDGIAALPVEAVKDSLTTVSTEEKQR